MSSRKKHITVAGIVNVGDNNTSIIQSSTIIPSKTIVVSTPQSDAKHELKKLMKRVLGHKDWKALLETINSDLKTMQSICISVMKTILWVTTKWPPFFYASNYLGSAQTSFTDVEVTGIMRLLADVAPHYIRYDNAKESLVRNSS